jgi:hypothetical protein
MPFLNWLIRPILLLAAVIAGWLVAKDAPNFTVIQMVVAIFLLTVVIGLAAFWEGLASWLRDRKETR